MKIDEVKQVVAEHLQEVALAKSVKRDTIGNGFLIGFVAAVVAGTIVYIVALTATAISDLNAKYAALATSQSTTAKRVEEVREADSYRVEGLRQRVYDLEKINWAKEQKKTP